ncbi:hypothetical protein [Pelagibius marinus]|uniref:hypothetical protein n=1 Tax=Pelagibius marinus TaxID=2762760 RepID=UPI001872A587|nr:hypothetical protein [Pelagibius marinus]
MLRISAPLLALTLSLSAPGLALGAASTAMPMKAESMELTGEVIDTWCYLSGIMYAEGTAHHQCAIWCAAGGVPVGLLTEDGDVYFIVEFEGRSDTLADPGLLEIQTHQISIDGDVYERDGLKYLSVNKVLKDEGIVNLTHEEYGIQPFGE